MNPTKNPAQQPATNPTKVSTDASGSPRFRGDMTVGEALQVHPGVFDVFQMFHLGGCSHCGVSPDDTLDAVGRNNGIPVEALLEQLNALA
jgi:hybrid cluster-associated redox disulfide protein